LSSLELPTARLDRVEDLTSDHLVGYDPPERLRQLPTWLTAQVAAEGRRLVNASLAQDGARRQHFTVLASLSEQGPASQADLGRRLSIDRSDLHALLAQLESDGLVARVRDERDRRRNVVTLTGAGRGALERLGERIDAAQDALLEPLSTRERRELTRLLQKVLEAR
jgi:MarR family transcriptional regulator, lower aerobic nicotinate degradation pathway regulator